MTRRFFFAVLAGAPLIRPKASGVGVWYPEFALGSDPYRMTLTVTRFVPAYVTCDEATMARPIAGRVR